MKSLDEQLFDACGDGNLSKVKTLIKNGANVNYQNDHALIWASIYGHLEIVKYLVEKGADIHSHNNEALRWASKNDNFEVVKYLNRIIKIRKL